MIVSKNETGIKMIHQLLTWRAIVDILLISGMIFFLYRTLTHLGTWKIVTGVLIALFFYFRQFHGIERH